VKKFVLALFLALIPTLAWAQGAVLQGGAIVKFDLPGWVQDKTISSGSKIFTDNFRGFQPFHVYDGGGPAICTEDALTNGPYHQICFGHDSSGNATISINNGNGATAKAFNITVNGNVYPFPGPGTGNVLGPTPTVVGNAALWNNTSGGLLADAGAPPTLRVNTNAALKALTAGIAAVVQRTGYYATGDSGSIANYYWDGASACADDGGACIIPNSNPGTGRWRILTHTNEMDVRLFGAKCDDTTNDQVALQKAVTFMGSIGGGIVRIPAMTCLFNSSVTISSSGVSIEGINSRQSVLHCIASGATVCLNALGTNTGAQVYGVFIKNLRVTGTSLAGTMVDLRFAAQSGLEHVVLDNYFNGLSVSGTNDIRLRDVYLSTVSAGSGNFGIRFWSQVLNERSDLLQMDHVTIQENFGGADCMIWDGFTNTVRMNGVNMLGCAKGVSINPSLLTTNYPQFMQVNNLEVDSATDVALLVNGFAQMIFVVNSQLTSNAAVPAVYLGNHMLDAEFTANRILGGNYGARVDSGSFHIAFVNNDFNSSTTGALQDNSGIAQLVGGTDFNGLPLGFNKYARGTAPPTLSSCGTGATVNGTATQGVITTGTGTVTSCTMNFAGTTSFSSAPVCSVTASNTAFAASVTAINTGGVTYTFTVSIPSTFVYYRCDG
jgi:hypothetical protein